MRKGEPHDDGRRARPAALAPPPAATNAAAARGPQPFRWTVAEYRQLDRTGLFADKKTMLPDGEIYAMVMPAPPHDAALTLTQDFLRAAFAEGHFVRCQMGFDIGLRNDPGPDLAVVVGAIRDHATRTPTSAIMVVEVAHTSLFIDTATKAELYATAGVPDYWVVDVEGRKLLVFRDPEPLPLGLGASAYRTKLALEPTDTASPLAAPTAFAKVADLLP